MLIILLLIGLITCFRPGLSEPISNQVDQPPRLNQDYDEGFDPDVFTQSRILSPVVDAECSVSSLGKATNCAVASTAGEGAPAIKRYLENAHFHPAIRADRPVAATYHVRFTFPQVSTLNYGGPIPYGTSAISKGTGWFVNSGGMLLTAAHVVTGCSRITIASAGLKWHVVRLRAIDPGADLALLQAEGLRTVWLPIVGDNPPRPTVLGPKLTVQIDPGAIIQSQRAASRADEILHYLGYPENNTSLSEANQKVVGQAFQDGKAWLVVQGRIPPGVSGGPLLRPDGTVAGVAQKAMESPHATPASKAESVKTDKLNKYFSIHQAFGFAYPSSYLVPFLESHNLEAMAPAQVIPAPNARDAVVKVYCFRGG